MAVGVPCQDYAGPHSREGDWPSVILDAQAWAVRPNYTVPDLMLPLPPRGMLRACQRPSRCSPRSENNLVERGARRHHRVHVFLGRDVKIDKERFPRFLRLLQGGNHLIGF